MYIESKGTAVRKIFIENSKYDNVLTTKTYRNIFSKFKQHIKHI